MINLLDPKHIFILRDKAFFGIGGHIIIIRRGVTTICYRRKILGWRETVSQY